MRMKRAKPGCTLFFLEVAYFSLGNPIIMRARVAEWSKAMDLGSILAGVQGFESLPSHGAQVGRTMPECQQNYSVLCIPKPQMSRIFFCDADLSSLMDIYILRHGKASTPDRGDTEDGMRHLTARGAEEIEAIAGWMREREMVFSAIASSPLARAKETASLVSRILCGSEMEKVWDELSPGVQPDAVARRLADLPPKSCILLVGHEPQLSSLVSLLISNSPDCDITLKKGGLARIRLEEGAASGTLLWLLPPGLIRDLSL